MLISFRASSQEDTEGKFRVCLFSYQTASKSYPIPMTLYFHSTLD